MADSAGPEEDGAEHEEAQRREQVTQLLGQADHAPRACRRRRRGRHGLAPDDPEGETGHPGGDEAAAAQGHGDGVTEGGDRQRGHPAPLLAHPAADGGPGEQPRPESSGGEADRGTEPQGESEDLARACALGVTGRRGEQHDEEGQRDPVVESALDIESLPDRRGNPWVGDRGLSQSRVGRRQDDGDQRELPHGEAGQQGPGTDGPEHHREGQSQAEQPQGKGVVPPQIRPPHSGGVGEQDRDQCHLEQESHCLRVAASCRAGPSPSGPLASPAATSTIGPDTTVGANRRETRATPPTDAAAAATAHALTGSPRRPDAGGGAPGRRTGPPSRRRSSPPCGRPARPGTTPRRRTRGGSRPGRWPR